MRMRRRCTWLRMPQKPLRLSPAAASAGSSVL
jgi:hypothetical protein